MSHSNLQCRVLEKTWVTPTIMRIRFEPRVPIRFHPGQFITVSIPTTQAGYEMPRRCYSLGASFLESERFGYEIYVRFVPGGLGSEYLMSLEQGDSFFADGPFGDFTYQRPRMGRNVCFICTSSGASVFRAMVGSAEFRQSPPLRTFLLMGARSEREIYLNQYFESRGVEFIPCLSRPENPDSLYFSGSVMDYLKQQSFINLANTDFYICGSPKMVSDVVCYLRFNRLVPQTSIHTENYRVNLVHPPSNVGRVWQIKASPQAENPTPTWRKAA